MRTQSDHYSVQIVPELYEMAYEKLAKPHGMTVQEAINVLLATMASEGEEEEKHAEDDG